MKNYCSIAHCYVSDRGISLEILSKNEIVQMHDELKQLRVQLVNLNTQINIAENPDDDFDENVKRISSETKEKQKTLKLRVSSLEGIKL